MGESYNNPMPRLELETAYRETNYWVDAPDGRFAIRIGQRCESLDHLLAVNGASTWAFITACNPGSQQLLDTENLARQRQLEAELRAAGYRYVPGEGKGTISEWPGEPSFFIIEIDKPVAFEIARRHGQLALVVGVVGETPKLVWTDEIVS